MAIQEDRHLITLIKEAQGSLRSSEQKVADFILGNIDEIPPLNITELGTRSGTSEATVSRFCRNIGLTDYREFRLLLTTNLATARIATIPQSIKSNDDIQTIADKLLYVLSETLRSTRKVLDEGKIDRAIDYIGKASKVYLFGVGGSGAISRIAHHLFLKAGIVTTVYDDGYMQAVTAALLRKGDLAFGISHSGETKDVVNALRIAKNNGATTIALTGKRDSAITEVADIRLVTVFDEEPVYGDFMEAKVGQLYIINLLYIGLILRNLPDSLKSIEETAKAIWERSYHTESDR